MHMEIIPAAGPEGLFLTFSSVGINKLFLQFFNPLNMVSGYHLVFMVCILSCLAAYACVDLNLTLEHSVCPLLM